MASSFDPVLQPGSNPTIVLLAPDTADDFTKGDLVFLDTADNLVKECGADPALILGIAQAGVADRSLYNGKVPVLVIEPWQVWAMGSATTPAEAHLYDAYDIVQTSGRWLVDTGGTGATRVVVINYAPKSGDQGQEMFYVKFLAANLQGDAVAS